VQGCSLLMCKYLIAGLFQLTDGAVQRFYTFSGMLASGKQLSNGNKLNKSILLERFDLVSDAVYFL